MSSGVILAGLGLAAVGFGGRYIARTMPQMAQKMEVHSERKPFDFVFYNLDVFRLLQRISKCPNWTQPRGRTPNITRAASTQR